MERAFTAYVTGTYQQPPQFGHNEYWRPLQIFYGHVDRISENHWHCVLALGGNRNKSDEDLDANKSMISAYRGDFYVPSSPLKA